MNTLTSDTFVTPVEPEAWIAPLFHSPLRPGATACCCPAPAVFAVVVAPSAELPYPPDVLLCAHHARAAHERFERPGIALYDAAGDIVTEHLSALLADVDGLAAESASASC